MDAESFDWEVIGVISDVNQMSLGSDPSGEIYLPHQQWQWPSMYLVLRTAARPESLIPAARQTIREIDDDITISRTATMEEILAASLASNRFLAGLTTAFAVLALVLGATVPRGCRRAFCLQCCSVLNRSI